MPTRCQLSAARISVAWTSLRPLFSVKEARDSFGAPSLFDEAPFNQIGGAYVFAVSPGHTQMVEQGLHVIAEGGAQGGQSLLKLLQHISCGGFSRLACWSVSNGIEMSLNLWARDDRAPSI